MKIYLHGRKGQLHSWTPSDVISENFIYQRSILGHDYIVKQIKLHGLEKDDFMDQYGQLKLCTTHLHNINGQDVVLYMLDDERYEILEQTGITCAKFAELSTVLDSFNFNEKIKDALEPISVTIDLLETLYDYEVENMCNTVHIARDVLNKKYREF